MTTINGSIITKEMLRNHAEERDADFMGEIVIEALGIRGSCVGFCPCKRGILGDGSHINLFWERDGEEFGTTFYEGEILKALEKVSITVERK